MHSGRHCSILLSPTDADSRIHFLTRAGQIPARAEFVIGTQRCTALGCGQAAVTTVEHLLSALSGMQIDNAQIELDGPEIPIMDGSAGPFVDAILDAGIRSLDA